MARKYGRVMANMFRLIGIVLKRRPGKSLCIFGFFPVIFILLFSNIVFARSTNEQPLISNLAPLASSQSPQIKRELLADLYRSDRLIWQARSEKYLSMLDKYNAQALMLPSGRYVMRPETYDDDLSLIRACVHEDFEVLMQWEERLNPGRYERLSRDILGREDVMAVYDKLAGHHSPEFQTDSNIIFNALMAKSLELIFLIDEELVELRTELIREEQELIEIMRPVLEEKHNELSPEFFDFEQRTALVKRLQEDKDERFYRAADIGKKSVGVDVSNEQAIVGEIKALSFSPLKNTNALSREIGKFILEMNRHNPAVVGALVNIVEIGIKDVEEKVLRILVAGLCDHNSYVRVACAQGLGEIFDKGVEIRADTVDILITGLDDEDWNVRLNCVGTLKKILTKGGGFAKEVLDGVIVGINNDSWRVRKACVGALERAFVKGVDIEERGLAALISSFDDANWNVRVDCARALGNIIKRKEDISSRILPLLEKGIEDDSEYVRKACVGALEEVLVEGLDIEGRGLAALISSFNDADWSIRMVCAQTLGRVIERRGDISSRILPLLEEGLEDDNRDVRKVCAEVLEKSIASKTYLNVGGDIAGRGAVDREGSIAGKTYLNMGESITGGEVVDSGGSFTGRTGIDREELAMLISGLEDGNRNVENRLVCAKGLKSALDNGEDIGSEGLYALVSRLGDSNREVRLVCAQALEVAVSEGIMPMISFEEVNLYYNFFKGKINSSSVSLSDSELTSRIAVILSIHAYWDRAIPAEVRFVSEAIDAAGDPESVSIMLEVMKGFSLRGSVEAQGYMENRIAGFLNRRVPNGSNFVYLTEKDELFIEAVMGSFRQNSLMPILTGRKFSSGIRVKVMNSLAKKGYIDSAYSGLPEDDGNQYLKIIEGIYDGFGIIPSKSMADNLLSGKTSLNKLKEVKPYLDQILAGRDYRELIRKLAEDDELSFAYYMFYQSPFQYPGTESVSYERFMNMVKSVKQTLQYEDIEVVDELKRGFMSVGLNEERAGQIIEALRCGRPPLPDDSPYLDEQGGFIPQRVDVLSVLGRSYTAETAQLRFNSSIDDIVTVLKINDFLTRIPRGIQLRFKNDEKKQVDLMGKYEQVKGGISGGVDLNETLKRLSGLNDENFPPEGRKRDINEIIVQAVNKQIRKVSMWQYMVGMKKGEQVSSDLIYLKAVDINTLVRNMGQMIQSLRDKANIYDDEISPAQVLEVFFYDLSDSLKIDTDSPLYDIYVELKDNLITAYDNYIEAISEKVELSNIPKVVYVDFVAKNNLLEFFRFADGAHCCLTSDPAISDRYLGQGVYERQFPRYQSNATSFWFQFSTDDRSGKQIGWFECWFGLEEGRVMVGTELLYLSPSYHNNHLQKALLAKIEEILFTTNITKIGQAAFGNHASNALLPPDNYKEEVLRIIKLQSLDDGKGSIYEDAEMAVNEPVAVILHVKPNPNEIPEVFPGSRNQYGISLEFISPDRNNDLVNRLLTIEEQVFSEDKRADEDYMREHLSNDRGIAGLFKDEAAGEIVGYVHSAPANEAWPMPAPEDNPLYAPYAGADTLYISDIALLPRYQGKVGMGDKLRKIFGRAKEKGYKYVALHTESRYSDGTASLSEKLQGMGFEVQLVEPDWRDTGEEYDFLVLDLSILD